MNTNDPLHPYPGTVKQHNVKSAEEQAAERYPKPTREEIARWSNLDAYINGAVYCSVVRTCAECLTERAIPAEQKLEEAMKTMQILVDALGLVGGRSEYSDHLCNAIAHKKGLFHGTAEPCPGIKILNTALSLASEKHGIKPSIQ